MFYRAALANFIIVFFPICAAVLVAMAITSEGHFRNAGISVMILGWVLLVSSKWPQIRRGDLLSWGVSSSHSRKVYYSSYAVIIAGFILACL